MSFFQSLLGGALEGSGAGIEKQRVQDEKELLLLTAQREKMQGALDLQKQRGQDALDRAELVSAMRQGGVGGKSPSFLDRMIDETDPVKLKRMIEITRNAGGTDAARMQARAFGMPEQESVNPTTGDLGNGQSTEVPVARVQAAAIDEQKGRVALNRAFVLFSDPAKTDDYMKAERGNTQNDFGAASAKQTLKDGGGIDDAANAFNNAVSPANDLRQQTVDATNARTAAMQASGGARIEQGDRRLLVEQEKNLSSALSKAQTEATKALGSTAKQAAQKNVDTAQANLQAFQAKSSSVAPTPSSQPGAYTYTGRKPADAAKAFKGN